MRKLSLIISIALVSIGLVPCAHAHTSLGGSTHEFLAVGFHPFTSVEHIVVMLSVGLVAAWQKESRQWLLLAIFAVALMFGIVAGAGTVDAHSLAIGLAMSLVIVGLALVAPADWLLSTSLPAVIVLGFLHGQGHTAQFHSGAVIAPQLVLVGLLAVTLPMTGLIIGRRLGERFVQIRRIGGALLATAGIHLFINIA